MTLTPLYFFFFNRESPIPLEQLQQRENCNNCSPDGPSASPPETEIVIEHYLAPDGKSEYSYVVKKGRLLKPKDNTGLHGFTHCNATNHYDTVGCVIRTVCCTIMTHSFF